VLECWGGGIEGEADGHQADAGSGCRSRRTAIEAWRLWPTDWFSAASLVRKGPKLVSERVGWPYLWQKSR